MSAISSAVYHLPAQRTIQRVEPTRVADLPPEEQEKIRAHLAESYARLAEHDRKMAEMERKHQELVKGYESNGYCAPYVQGLSREQALTQIYFASEVIRNGQEEKYTLSTSLDGKQTTSNFRQYVYWLQQHVKELDGAGQSTLAQA